MSLKVGSGPAVDVNGRFFLDHLGLQGRTIVRWLGNWEDLPTFFTAPDQNFEMSRHGRRQKIIKTVFRCSKLVLKSREIRTSSLQ